MIYTITFSPSIDYTMNVKELKSGEINRSVEESYLPGGKGINVSIVLKNLGMDSKALGFIGGFSGQYILNELKQSNVFCDFVEVSGNSRINVKIKSKKETAINGKGPDITNQDIEALFTKLEKIQDGDYLIISGNVPSTIRSSIYEEILQNLKEKKIHIIVDATNDLLLKSLKYKPFFVKPNKEELEEMFQVSIHSFDDLVYYARQLQVKGALNVGVSLGGEGAILVDQNNNLHHFLPPKGTLINSVGAGDSLVAGFVYQYIRTNNFHEAMKYGVLTGSASAFKEGLANKNEVEELNKNYREKKNDN